MSSTTKRRSPGILSQVFGVVLGLGVTCVVAMILQVTLIGALASTGLIRGPRDPGRATAIEAWLIHNWPLLVIVELLVGGLVAWRVCRPLFQGKRHWLLPNNTMQPTGAPSGAGG